MLSARRKELSNNIDSNQKRQLWEIVGQAFTFGNLKMKDGTETNYYFIPSAKYGTVE